jgi:hypothetical protein
MRCRPKPGTLFHRVESYNTKLEGIMRIAIAALFSITSVSIISISVSVVSLCAQPSQPTDFDGWKTRGGELLRADKFQEAADAFQHAADLRPDDASIHQLLGSACANMYVPPR